MKWMYIGSAIVGGLIPGIYLFSRFRVNSALDLGDIALLSFGLGLAAAPLFFCLAVLTVRLLQLSLGLVRASRRNLPGSWVRPKI